MEDFDDFIGRDLKVFGVDQAFIVKLKWMDRFVKDEVRFGSTFVVCFSADGIDMSPRRSCKASPSELHVPRKASPRGCLTGSMGLARR